MQNLRLPLGALAIALAGTALAGTPTYTLTDLGAGPVGSIEHVGMINDNGQVVGYSNDGGWLRPWYWSQGTGMVTYGPTGSVHVAPTGITDSGVVYGNEQGPGYIKGFQWQPGGSYGYFNPVPGGGDSQVYAVDRGGNVLFTVGAQDYVYDGSASHQIDPIESQGIARLINASGQVGGYDPKGLPNDSFLWTNGTGYDYTGTFAGGGAVVAQGINDSGYLTGYADTTDGMRAFLWSKASGLVNLGALSSGIGSLSRGYSVNDSLQVVGQSTINNHFAAFYSDPVNGMVDLAGLVDGSGAGWSLYEADSINDAGQIVGLGLYDGQYHAFLLTPAAPAVPGPAAALPWLAGSVAVWLRRRRART